MKPYMLAKIGTVLVVAIAVVMVLRLKQAQTDAIEHSGGSAEGNLVSVGQEATLDAVPFVADEIPAAPGASTPVTLPSGSLSGLPTLIDLGADKCVPCKRMAPMLKALRGEFDGRFDVVFIDVWKNKEAATPYRLKLIPTQLFFDEQGNELFRHQGYFSRDDILGTWERLGYAFGESPQRERGDIVSSEPEVVAYYFHGDLRCESCLSIEAQAEAVIIASFSEALSSGRLAWKAVNYDREEDKHFAEDFDLAHSSLVLVRSGDGNAAQWEVLEEVWDHLGDDEAFNAYVREQTRRFLNQDT